MKNKETRECVICKKLFIPNVANQIYCNKQCGIKALSERRKSVKIENEGKPKNKKPKMSVAEIAVAARAAGMSYGQYVEKMKL